MKKRNEKSKHFEDNPPRKSWWKRLGEIWTTSQMASYFSKEIEVRTTLRELLIYLIYLIILLILALGMVSTTMYYYTNVMMNLFLDTPTNTGSTFKTSATIQDFWSFAESVMIDNFFWEFWYGEEDNENYRVSDDDLKILHENILLGLPRLRQEWEQNIGDSLNNAMENVVQMPVSLSFWNQTGVGSVFDTENGNVHNLRTVCIIHFLHLCETCGEGRPCTNWEYNTPKNLRGISHWGFLTTYGGGGYYQDLPTNNKTKMMEIVQELKENLWITRGTRVIFLDFSVYNANINLFCIIKLILELPPTGGLLPSWTFRTVKLLRYVTTYDYFILACELIFITFIFYYTVEELRELTFFKMRYFYQGWNLLDALIIMIAYVCLFFNIYRYTVVNDLLKDLLEKQNKFVNFDFLGFWQTQYNNAIAILVFFSWIKVFKYVSFNRTMTQLSTTLSRCAKDVAGFAVMFFIVFLAFAQLGHLLFGTQVQDFSNFSTSVFTLLRTILGDFNYDAIEEANRILGPIFFLSYIFFVFFVLLNMFLAIINDTYSEVKSEISAQQNEFEIADFLHQGYVNLMHKFGIKDKFEKHEEKDKTKITYNQIRNTLRKCNFTDLEIQMFFAKYDIQVDQEFGEKEATQMLGDLEGKRTEDVSDAAQPSTSGYQHYSEGEVSKAEFDMLKSRVEYLEQSIGSIINKVDDIIAKIRDNVRKKAPKESFEGKHK